MGCIRSFDVMVVAVLSVFLPLFERDIVVASDSALNVRRTNRTETVDRKWGMSIRRNKVENEKQLLVKRTLES